ncbi:ATP-binding cassette sub-family C member 4-like [Oculina patagonica]
MAQRGSNIAYTQLEKEQKEGKEETASVNDRVSLCSNITYSWLSKTLSLGYKRPLELPDLPYTMGQELTKQTAKTFEKAWSREVKNSLCEDRSPRLWSTVIKSIGCWNLALVFFTATLASVCRVIQQVLLISILTLMAAGTQDTHPWLATSGFIISLCVELVVKNQYFYIAQQVIRTRITSGLIALVYKKLLSTRSSELADVTAGHVINLISKDLQPLRRAASHLPISIVGCLEFIAMGVLLWYFLSWMALTGMLYLVLIGFCQFETIRPISKLRKETQSMADQRNAKLKNVISGIRIVKMNAWESLFERMILAVRRKEIHAIQKKNFIYGALTAMRRSYPATACFLSLVALWGVGINLTPATVFTASLMFKTLDTSVVQAVVEGAYNLSLCKATMSRLESFLTNGDPHGRSIGGSLYNVAFGGEKPDREEFKQRGPTPMANSDIQDKRLKDPGIQMINVSSQIKKKEDPNMFRLLKGVSLHCNERDLVAITGSAGSGKSSILKAIVGEIPVTDGKNLINGKIAYMPQNPWLFSGTVQENILFGNHLNEHKYHATIEACALIDDLKQLPFGDMTQVGESGAALSGGQKARVCLARTVYSDADIFLLDSPLKAVDAKVGELIYEKCICGLLSTRPRIHVTHNKRYLCNASVVLTMENGCIVSREKPVYKEDEEDEQTDAKEILKEGFEPDFKVNKRHVYGNVPSSGEEGISTAEEDRETGSLSINMYMKYFRAGASVLGVLICFLLIVFPAAVNMVLGFWLADLSRKTLAMQQDNANIYIYAGFQFGLFLTWLLGVYFFLHLTINCARNLHSSMLRGILKAPALFFDTNPAGRILNRFSKDTEGMDEMLPQTLINMGFFIPDHFFAILLICISDYWLILPYLCCLFPAVLLVRYYLRSSVEFRRLEAISASSVYSLVDETLTGISVIRNFGREEQFQETLFRLQDKNNTAYMCGIGANRWMANRLEGMILLLLTAAMVLTIFTRDAATTGLFVVFSRSVLMSVFRIASLYAFLEIEMTSVERCVSYSQLEPEPGYLVETVPPESWPEEGSINFKDCSLVYYPGGPRVLKNFCLTIKPGEKIGITGRTGAGKSSLVAALFRMPEPEGKILIDGIPINSLNIQEARKSLTVVPQQAFLFGGTLRQNLDPEEKHLDKEIWDILEKVALKSMVDEHQGKLDFWITENGSNLSGGEQQLICIARALLQKRKVVIFDEAMASMDLEADQLIQGILKKELRNRTMLTIAHRLDSILDYDKIVVIDEGQIVEFGSPESLLRKKDGKFYCLYEHYRSNTS